MDSLYVAANIKKNSCYHLQQRKDMMQEEIVSLLRRRIESPLFSESEIKGISRDVFYEEEFVSKLPISNVEEDYTSTGNKLLYHRDVLKKLVETGIATPIVSHIMPTDYCNFSCSFCSVRDRKTQGEFAFLELERDIKPYIDSMSDLGLKAVILSGGGEPTAYRDSEGHDFRDLVNYLHSKHLEIGLITNGSLLSKFCDVVDKLSWIRVSLYLAEYSLDRIKLPPKKYIKNLVLGFSWIISPYYFNSDINETIELDSKREIVDFYMNFWGELASFVSKSNGRYIRLAPDCHIHGEAFVRLHESIIELNSELSGCNLTMQFHQHKFHRAPDKCYLGFFHPVLYADGYVYPCDSVILNNPEDRRFNKHYALFSGNNIEAINDFYKTPIWDLMGNTRYNCPRCVFYRNNQLIGDIVKGQKELGCDDGECVVHKNFI